jgi:predicted dithiol-disulfide oxidoreductase (DUF899 family)
MTHFPNESNEYRRARAALLDEEIELRQRIAHVADYARSRSRSKELPPSMGYWRSQ